jgi:hypothetical protein
VTAFSTDPGDIHHLLVAVGARLFRSTTGGSRWTEIPLGGIINESTYMTALAADPLVPGRWAFGTSYDGIYLTEDAGTTWTEIAVEWDVGELSVGAGFQEEVAALEFAGGGELLAELGFGGGFVSLDLATRTVLRLRPVTEGPRAYRAPSLPPLVMANPADASVGGTAFGSGQDHAAADRRALAAGRSGIYVAASNASPEQLADYLDLIERRGFNSIVVDLKDDYGVVTYATSLEAPRLVGAVEPMVDIQALAAMAHERDVYVIGRLVLFKDRRLYRHEDHRLALRDSSTGGPWGVFRRVVDQESGEERTIQVEHWVDPYSPEVWHYNLSIAEEAVALGVDEIQFDYVRFPSDGNTTTIRSRFALPGVDRVQALEGFLAEARRRIAAPIGIDVFGFNAWARMSYLGQDISRLGEYVDVISPMFYPSHFVRSFLPHISYLERSRVIYEVGTKRARQIAGGGVAGDEVLIRPYVQAFLIGPELEYEAPEYFEYLRLQLRGAANASSDGYTLWNAAGRYYMLP